MQHRGRCISGDSHPMRNMLGVVIANGACPPDGKSGSCRKTPAPPMRQPVSTVPPPALARKPPSGKKPPIPSSPKPRPTSPSAWTTAFPTAAAGRLPARVAALMEAPELLQGSDPSYPSHIYSSMLSAIMEVWFSDLLQDVPGDLAAPCQEREGILTSGSVAAA